MKHLILTVLAAGVAMGAQAVESPLWLRSSAISPDASTVAFTYKGDIYTVPTSGGIASRLTVDPDYDANPLWSPDGSRLAFSSNRLGSDDIFVMPAKGGTPVRITTHSGNETPLAWLDNSRLLFSANLQPAVNAAQGPFQSQVYVVDVDKKGSRPQMYVSLPMTSASVDAAGRVLYGDKKGYEDILRKHERSSGTSDVWLKDGDKYTMLTRFNGHDMNPLWGQGDIYYYVSEEDGTLNVWQNNLAGTAKRQLTKFTKHPVRSLSAASNGTLAFSWNGELYLQRPGAEPVKINVEIVGDDFDNDQVRRFVSSGATAMSVSPNGEEVAFVLRGDIFVTSVKYETTRRITDTPAQERTVQFSPDGKSLVYDSDRGGHWQLFIARPKNEDDKLFTYATEIVEEPLYSCATSAQQPQFSPDGKKVAFLENRTELKVIDVKSKKTNTALDGKYNYSYLDGDVSFEWAPDSKWLLASYIGVGGWNNTDIALVKADGSEVIDLTESGYSDGNPKWALGGKAITYETGRYGMKSHGSWGNTTDIVLMVLDGDAWDEFNYTEEEKALAADADKKKKDDKKDDDKDSTEVKIEKVKALNFDLANRKYRRVRLTDMSGFLGDYYLDPEGETLYYVAYSPEGEANLYKKNIKDDETKVLARGVSGGFQADSKGENLYILSGSGMSKLALASGSSEPIKFSADYNRHPSLEREYIYDHMLQQVAEKFYDANLHGVDWKGYGEAYRRFLPYINNNRDFAILLSEILGELNASHTGGRYSSPYGAFTVGNLGAFFDETYQGNGLKVSEVIARGPLASTKADVRPGDIITHIDGKAIEAGQDYYPLLEGKAGRKVRLTVDRKGRKSGDITVRPIGGELSSLLYQRWVEHNQHVVDSLSGGRVGYVHVQGMNSPSFSSTYDQVLGKYRNCDAIIVDTRYNGGGWLHNDLAVILSGREYAKFMPRGKYIGSEPFSQWHKPSVMLVNESNYSDAHGSPYAYQTLKIGDVVGAPIPGTMTAVWWETQIDPTLYFGIPQVANTNLDGKPLENVQLNPEVIIYNTPEHELNGIDDQLIGATRHLMEKINRQNK